MKNILFFLKKNIKIILVFIFFIIYFLYAYFVSRSLPINSDIANHMLQSQDFLSGNFLMKGWIFTGITFLTTDLIFYNIAELFCKGINCNSFYLSSTLMFFSVVLTYFLVICKNKKNIISIIIFLRTQPRLCLQLRLRFQILMGIFLFCMASSAFWCPVLYIYSFSFVL